MSDSRGLQLSAELLENFPDIPASLEFLKWTIGENSEKEYVYRIESGDRVKAVEWHHGISPET